MCQRLPWFACVSITVLHLVSSNLIPRTFGHTTNTGLMGLQKAHANHQVAHKQLREFIVNAFRKVNKLNQNKLSTKKQKDSMENVAVDIANLEEKLRATGLGIRRIDGLRRTNLKQRKIDVNESSIVNKLSDMMCSVCRQLNDVSCMQIYCLNAERTPVSVNINSNIGLRTINKMAAYPPKQKSAVRLAVAV